MPEKPNYELNLKKGWNLFSTPIYQYSATSDTSFLSFSTNCQFTGSLWGISNFEKQYYKVKYITSDIGQGYWIKTANDCTVYVRGDKAYSS